MSARHLTFAIFTAFAALTACSGDDTTTDAGQAPDTGSEPDSGNEKPDDSWQIVHENLDAALTSVSGTSARNVFAVGAHDRDGSLVLHFDGERWQRIPTDSEADLWWVLVLDEDTVLATGTEGTILRFDPERMRFTSMDTPGTRTVFGVWGTEPDALFAVGGDPDESPGFVWRFDGSDWRDVSSELPEGEDGPVLFKMWGQSEDDAFLVGMEGTTIHWDGERFESVDSGQDRRLFTVHGVHRDSGQDPDAGTSAGKSPRFVAVGGFGSGVILEHDGTRWHDVTPEEDPKIGATPQLFGVFLRELGEAPDQQLVGYAVGFDGAILRRDSKAWVRVAPPVELFLSFHAVWIDPDGGVWAVGGDVITDALDQGMLLHHGKKIPSTIE